MNKKEEKEESGENVIDRIEECLAVAKEGKITNCIIVMSKNDGLIAASVPLQ